MLLGQLAQRAPRRTAEGPLYKRDEEEIEPLFAPALGARTALSFLTAADRLGLAFTEETEALGRSSRSVRIDPDAVEAFLALHRAARLKRLAEAIPLPAWLAQLFSSGGRFVPSGALAAARHTRPQGWPELGNDEEWMPFLLAAVFRPAVALRAARNDKCPCGSGQKYKHCCLPRDLATGGGEPNGAEATAQAKPGEASC